ncbi:hypothetical protein J4462_03025 [Candidatus Pacearchaeota archaeon]|nr:hypothetical protein [Candidatus Pacearchaeota archaeon]
MALCGFNQEMLEGLSGFYKGLVEHGILERSKKKKQATETTINKELEDMNDFLRETRRIEDPEIKDLTEALTKHALSYYKFVQKKGVKNYKEIIQFLNDYYFAMDDKYYSELEGKPEAMKKLAIYLNEKVKKMGKQTSQTNSNNLNIGNH